jgi:hypothetical protein
MISLHEIRKSEQPLHDIADAVGRPLVHAPLPLAQGCCTQRGIETVSSWPP